MNLNAVGPLVSTGIICRVDIVEVLSLHILMLDLFVDGHPLLLASILLLAQRIRLLLVLVLTELVSALRSRQGLLMRFVVYRRPVAGGVELPTFVPRAILYRFVVAEAGSEEMGLVCSAESRSGKKAHAWGLPD